MRIALAAQRSLLLAVGLMLFAGGSTLSAQTAQAPAIGLATQQLLFAHQIGATPPSGQTLRVLTGPDNLPFTVTANSQGGWLLVNNALGTTGISGTATQDVIVSVNPAALTTAGDYTGTVSIASGSTSVNVNVTLSVSAAPQVRLDPNALNVSVEAGTSRTFNISVASTSTSQAAIPYVADVQNQNPPSNWLIVSPSNGTTGTNNAVVTINTAALPAGRATASGAIRFRTVGNGGGGVTIPVTLAVSAAATLTASPTTVTFPYQRTYAAPTTRTVNVTSSGSTQILYTASVTSDRPWLRLGLAAGVPGMISVQNVTPNPLYLIPDISSVASTPGTYTATITLTPTNGTAAQTITARLVVSDTPQLTVLQDPQPFVYTVGSGNVPQAQNVTLSATSGNLPFNLTPVYTSGGQWFVVSPTTGMTPTAIQIGVDPAVLSQLAAGSYAGVVRVTSGTTTFDIPVSLTVSGSTLLTVEGGPVTITAPQGQTPAARTIIVRSTDNTNQAFTVTVEPPSATWLVPSPTSGQTGATGAVITVTVNPTAVTGAGANQATLVITPTGVQNAVPYRVPVTYTVTGTTAVTLSPTQLTLTQAGNTPPPAQTINLTSPTGGLGFTVSATKPWIKLATSGSTIPATITVTFDTATLQAGTYTEQIDVIVPGVDTYHIPVRLTVGTAATLTIAPAALNFSYALGSANPAAQNLQVTSSGVAVDFTATAASTGNWLSVTPASGTTGAQGAAATQLAVNVNPANLAAGTYQGTITIAAAGATNASTVVNVTLTVAPTAVPQGITIANGATGVAGPVSPGMIATLRGRNMAPATGVSGKITNNVLETTLSDVRVTFDGVQAPLLYVGPSGDGNGDQINLVVPYGVAGRTSTRMMVDYKGNRSDPVDLRVVDTNPGIFTQTQTGTGLGAVLNEDNSVNTANAPAARGSIIAIWATGEGAVSPAGADGRIAATSADLRRPIAPVVVRINGQTAELLYAGSAGGAVAGAFQVNVRIPQNLNISAPTQVPLEVQVGSTVSQRGVTVAVR